MAPNLSSKLDISELLMSETISLNQIMKRDTFTRPYSKESDNQRWGGSLWFVKLTLEHHMFSLVGFQKGVCGYIRS